MASAGLLVFFIPAAFVAVLSLLSQTDARIHTAGKQGLFEISFSYLFVNNSLYLLRCYTTASALKSYICLRIHYVM